MNRMLSEQSLPKRNQYDSVFRQLFHKKEALLELYNAVNGSVYTDTEQLYSSHPIRLPFPVFIVFYNGREEMPEYQEYHLADLYHTMPLPVNLDLRVRVLNINPGYNEELVARSPYLRGYQIYTDKVRRYSAQMPLDQAVERAVQECIREDVLKEFLMENKKEVMDMSIFEFDQQLYIKVQRQEAMEDGIELGCAKMEALITHMMNDNRLGDLLSSLGNPTMRKTLLQEYSL